MHSLVYRGYRISWQAREWSGKWNVICQIEKPSQPTRRISFIMSECSIATAENAALKKGIDEINQLEQGSHLATSSHTSADGALHDGHSNASGA